MRSLGVRALRGEVYRYKQPDSRGDRRFVVIVSRNEMNAGHSVMVVPFFSQQLDRRATFPSYAVFDKGEGGLLQPCAAKADELKTLDKSQIDFAAGPLGRFDEAQMGWLSAVVSWVLSLGE